MRGFFSRRKADNAGVLSHAKEDNAAAREKDRKDKCSSELINYISNKKTTIPVVDKWPQCMYNNRQRVTTAYAVSSGSSKIAVTFAGGGYFRFISNMYAVITRIKYAIIQYSTASPPLGGGANRRTWPPICLNYIRIFFIKQAICQPPIWVVFLLLASNF